MVVLKNIFKTIFYWQNECIRSCPQDGSICCTHDNIYKFLQNPWPTKFKNNNLFWCIKICPQDGNWCNAHEYQKVLQSGNSQRYLVNIKKRKKEQLTNKILDEITERITVQTQNNCLKKCYQDGDGCDKHQWVKFLNP